uniref:BPTI/Kunitz inhibitor domain-containing protein n=1 Tax=Pelusios castaneus TaxID=367368 RepID=A0A8C8S2X0_9SAUR
MAWFKCLYNPLVCSALQSLLPLLCPSDICRLPVGPCTAVISRWFYNWRTKTCEEFSYGGCNGNKNNFETKAGCLRACTGQGKNSGNVSGAVSFTGQCWAPARPPQRVHPAPGLGVLWLRGPVWSRHGTRPRHSQRGQI